MSGIIQNFFNQATRLIRNTGKSKNSNIFSKIWYGPNNTFHLTSEEEIKDILVKRFPNATNINVNDASGGCGAMFEIYVETNDFKGLSIMKQHRSVYDALKEQIKNIHGLHLVTKVPP